jgi:hypothetical protein
MSKKVKFYDPHPGFAGAAARLPESMRKATEGLDGKKLSLEEALNRLQPFASKLKGVLDVKEEDKYISFLWPQGDIKHYYRLIRYS